MDTVNTTAPTVVEIDAAEKVLADAHSQPCDGYWRELGRSVLEAAADARLAAFVAITEAEFERRMDLIEDVRDDAAFDAALGEGRR